MYSCCAPDSVPISMCAPTTTTYCSARPASVVAPKRMRS